MLLIGLAGAETWHRILNAIEQTKAPAACCHWPFRSFQASNLPPKLYLPFLVATDCFFMPTRVRLPVCEPGILTPRAAGRIPA